MEVFGQSCSLLQMRKQRVSGVRGGGWCCGCMVCHDGVHPPLRVCVILSLRLLVRCAVRCGVVVRVVRARCVCALTCVVIIMLRHPVD